jgi:uncharacterized membrane protein YfcA
MLMLFLLGLAVGGYGTAVGAGGGFLLVPLLLFLYPAEAAQSVARLSLEVVGLNALVGTLLYARSRRIDYVLAAPLAICSMPAAMLGAAATHMVPRHVFDTGFGCVLLALATFLLRQPLASPARASESDPRPLGRRPFWTVASSVVVGALSGLLGIGGSPLQVAVLTHVGSVPVHTAMPTAQLLALISSVGGALAHLGSGHAKSDLVRVAPLGIGTMLGAHLGVVLSTKLRAATLMRLLAVGLLLIGARLLFVAFATW